MKLRPIIKISVTSMLAIGSLVIKLSMITINNCLLLSLIITLPNAQLKLLSWELLILNVSIVLVTNPSSIFIKRIVSLVLKEHNLILKLINANQLLLRHHPNVLPTISGMKLNKNVFVLMLSPLTSDVNVSPVWNHSSGVPVKEHAF